MSIDKRAELRQTVERYKKALAYLDTSTPFTYQKFFETHRIAGIAISDSDLHHKWTMSELMIEGTEGLRQILRDSLLHAIHTLEPLAEQLAQAAPSSQQVTSTAANVPQPPLNEWALASFILALLSLCGGLLTGVPAIVLGFVALRKMGTAQGQTRGKFFAWTGIGVGLALTAISIVLILVTLLPNTFGR